MTYEPVDGWAPWRAATDATVTAPAKGMMISDGSGMQADSIAMSKATPL